MRPVLTPDEMRSSDERTIAAGTPASVLMERAGRAVAWAVRRLVGTPYGLRAVALCGKGNNGGDALIAADALERWGARVARVSIAERVDRRGLERELARSSVVIDGMFGTGFQGALRGDPEWVVGAVNDADLSVVAVDIPSGVDGATGAVEGFAIQADRTVAMAALKVGLVQEPGRTLAGEIEIASIGIDPVTVELGLTETADVERWFPARSPDANKWSVGGVLVVGGADGMAGAPMMVSHAAMRAGAGIVWCAMPEGTAERVLASEVITMALPAMNGALAADASGPVVEHADRFGALVVGPGLTTAPETQRAVRSLVASAPRALVVDADGLNALATDLTPLRERTEQPTVLTPHEGEYARLANRRPGADRVAAARELASLTHAVVVLKGPGTIVAEPGGRAAVNPTGTPALASAGTGDVLAGLIGGLLAQGVPAFEAAASGVFLHGTAAQMLPPRGLIAPDLCSVLPRAIDTVLEGNRT